jgi:aminoglycoside 3-N-acetyltransferase
MLHFANLPRPIKARLRARLLAARRLWVRLFRSYGAAQLRGCLHGLGLRPGDTVMLHSAFGDQHGFKGSIDAFTDVFVDLLGPSGTLLMPSLPYRSSSLQYLQTIKQFDVRKTPSMMGLVSEYFRRRPGVLRSLHPTHPVLALGANAETIVAGHENCRYPCGPGTPFDSLLRFDGKVVFFNVSFATFTFFHYLEHRLSPGLPFPLYTDEPFEVPVIDQAGRRLSVTTYVFSPEAIRRRQFQVLEDELFRRGLITRRSVGNSRLMVIRVRDAVECVDDM